MTLDYRDYGIFLIMGNAGFIPSTVERSCKSSLYKAAIWGFPEIGDPTIVP